MVVGKVKVSSQDRTRSNGFKLEKCRFSIDREKLFYK